MKKREKIIKSPSDNRIRRSAVITIICDAVLLAAFVICLMVYISRNSVNTYNQNIEYITNVAAANSNLMQAALDNTRDEIERAYNYCNGKTYKEILDYLSLINTSSNDEYQILRRDTSNSSDLYHIYTGYSTRKIGSAYSDVKYENTSLSISIYNNSGKANGDISFSQSFTNKTDALRYFAVFCGITVNLNGTEQNCYLVKPQKESRVINQAQTISQYNDLSIAICYTDGKYLAHDNKFRATNFYDYIAEANDMSVDEKNALRTSVQNDDDGMGVMTYKDYQKRECIFAYAPCGDNENWLVIVSVPKEEFVEEKLLSFFPLLIISFLVVLLFFNIYRLLIIVSELRLSVSREQIANSSKSSFLSRMSHEIRTPLNAVIGYNTIARTEMSDAKTDIERKSAEMKVMDCLTKSEIASKHLLTIINDVLDMSAIESGKIKIVNDKFDFKGLITSLTTVFYSQARAKGVEFEVLFDNLTEEWFVGDQMRVNQILTNLLSNAIKFTSDGGTVKLKINQPEAATDSSHIHFEISDTGIGMTQEYLSHIWTPFEQADSSISRRFGGTGLGLSITKNLIDIMGGKIEVKSSVGVGTTFSVDLKFGKTTQPTVSHNYDFGSINALIVDDDISTCDYIRLLFNRCGARCATVTSGQDAIDAISVSLKQNDLYSLCLVDWRMPHMDGIETITHIRRIAGDNLPIIVLTAYDYSELADKAVAIGVNKFISKPLFQSSLFDLLANICGIPEKETSRKTDKYNFDGARILLAEDNMMNMEIAKTILTSAGFIVDGAWNGREAVNMFEASPIGAYTAILMDVHMPELNGHDATKEIRNSSRADAKTVPIIAMTADAFAENVAEAHAAGMNDHIAKPIDLPTLFETLKKYI